LEQYLSAFATYEQDNWLDLLLLAKFAYVQQLGARDHRTYPFFADHGNHPDMHVKLPTEASLPERTADKLLGKLQTARDRPRGSFLEAQARKTKYAGSKEIF
jgi:hypothetical protein